MGKLSGILYTIQLEDNHMWLTKILPKKFSSRLFWMTFIAGTHSNRYFYCLA